MSWLRRDKRKKKSAAGIAALLFKSFVEDDEYSIRPESYSVPPELASKFRDESRLYREAIVLLALSTQAGKEKAYEKVLHHYERLILPHRFSEEALRRLDDMNTAMADLNRLLQPGDRETYSGRKIMWAMEWLKRIGYEQSDAIVLWRFSHWWTSTYVTVCKIVNEGFRPGWRFC